MRLYEITTGRTGESYERCYAWAEDVKHALKLFDDNHKTPDGGCPAARCLIDETESDTPFITDLSDSGFGPKIEDGDRLPTLIPIPGSLQTPPMILQAPVVNRLPKDASVGTLVTHNGEVWSYAGRGRWLSYVNREMTALLRQVKKAT